MKMLAYCWTTIYGAGPKMSHNRPRCAVFPELLWQHMYIKQRSFWPRKPKVRLTTRNIQTKWPLTILVNICLVNPPRPRVNIDGYDLRRWLDVCLRMNTQLSFYWPFGTLEHRRQYQGYRKRDDHQWQQSGGSHALISNRKRVKTTR